MMTKLVVVFENGSFSVPVKESESIVGRGETCDIKIIRPEVSRIHCKVWVESGSAWIEDLSSRNGTFVNGLKIDSRNLIRHGDSITLGGVFIKVLEHEAEESFELSSASSCCEMTTRPIGWNISTTDMVRKFFRKY